MLTKQQEYIIYTTENYVRNKLSNDYSGHDFAHIRRVVNLAKKILTTEPQADQFIVIMAAYLHDIIDDKVIENMQTAKCQLSDFLYNQNVANLDCNAIFAIIENMSFKKNLSEKKPLSLEGKIVQDADRLDAIGAIGIGRAFLYGGHKKHIMYDPNIKPRAKLTEKDYRVPSTIINHFYEKLIKLKDQMNTVEALRLAEQRHQFLIEFINQFESEWV